MVAPAQLSGFARVTVHTPTTRVDLAVPDTVPVLAYLPQLLQQVGLTPSGDAGSGWALARVDGTRLDLARGLAENGVRDGDALIAQPARAVLDLPLFDDAVELAGHGAVQARWGRRQRRMSAAALLAGGALGAAAALARGAPGWVALGIAALLLGIAALLCRPLGDRPAGLATGLSALPFAVTGGPALLADPLSPAGLLLSCAGLVAVAVPVGALAARLPVACAGLVTGLLGGAAGGLALLTGADAARCASLAAVAAFALAPVLPALALRSCRVPRPEPTDHRPVDGPPAVLVQRVARARAVLSAVTGGVLAVVTVSVAVLDADGGAWSRGLAAVLVVLLAVRARVFAERATVLLWLAAAGLSAGAAVGVEMAGGRWVAPLAAGGVALALAAASGLGTRGPTPRLRWALDRLETLAHVALVPGVLGVWGVYATVPALGW